MDAVMSNLVDHAVENDEQLRNADGLAERVKVAAENYSDLPMSGEDILKLLGISTEI